jgi:L-threonylcarbamoyladenylate synthase
MKRLAPDQLDQAIELLKDGGVLIFPTETSYGIGCDATNDAAVKRVFALKDRPAHKGTPLLLPDADSADTYLVVTQQMQDLMKEHWPGPLNIIGEVAMNSPVSELCTEEGTQTVRVSSHPIAAALSKGLGRPVVATSANVYRTPAIYNSVDIEGQLEADAYVDAGALPEQPASTIVKVTRDGMEVVRQGGVIL